MIARRLLGLLLALSLIAGGAVSSLHRTLHAGLTAHSHAHGAAHAPAHDAGFFSAIAAQLEEHDEGGELCRLLDAASADSLIPTPTTLLTDAPETRVQLASSGIEVPQRAWLLPPSRAPPAVA
jgi:hypothetical protein